VSSEWLADRLGAANLRILDVRGEVGGQPPAKRADYDEVHIPGAVFADWTADFVDLDDPRPIQLASPEAFRTCAERLGIGDDDVVVTYDDYFDIFAGRMWWAMRAYGHDAVRVLDGGWRTWRAEARATTAATPSLPPATFTPRPVPALNRTLAEVEVALADGVTLIDARPRHLYDGDPDAHRTGHIPGAVNLPYPDLVDAESGLFRSRHELRVAVASVGIDPDDADAPVISSCGSGVSASVVCMALELLGRRDVPVFDGSFAEWVADLARPIAQGVPAEAG
jgi:thiosulfate/3-mercaptopyruvate sulfurtransferase